MSAPLLPCERCGGAVELVHWMIEHVDVDRGECPLDPLYVVGVPDPVAWWNGPSLRGPRPSAEAREALTWAVAKWRSEVAERPLVNQNRRPLDDAWRQMVRYFGGDDEALLGPRHDDLLALKED